MRVLVTGGTGFTGSHVVPRLVDRGDEVVALVRSATSAVHARAAGAKCVWGDLDDAPSVTAAFAQADCDILVNIASLGFGHAPTIVAATQSAGIERAVFVSTTSVFTSLNAPSKAVRLAAEEAIRSSDLDWTILRPTMIYGTPDDRNMWRLLRFLRRTPAVPLPEGGTALQQPVHVADLAMAICEAASRQQAIGRAYEVAGPEPLTFEEVVRQACAAMGRSPRLVPVPVSPIIRVLRLSEGRGLRLPLKAEQFERLVEDKAFEIGAAQKDLGYSPRPFAEGIASEASFMGEPL